MSTRAIVGIPSSTITLAIFNFFFFFLIWPLSLSAVRWRRARPGPRRGLAPMSLGGLYGPIGRETIVRGSAASRSTGDCGRARALVAAVVVLHGWMAVGAHAPWARRTVGRRRCCEKVLRLALRVEGRLLEML